MVESSFGRNGGLIHREGREEREGGNVARDMEYE